MKRLLVAASVLTFALPSWAGLLDDDEARKAILDLRNEVRQRDAQQTQSNQTVADQVSTLGIASANSMAKLRSDLAEQSKQIELLRATLLELNASLKNNRDDNSKLRGQLEVAQNNAQLSVRELQALKLKLTESEAANDARFKKLEPRTVAIDGKEALVDKAEEASFNAALNQFKAADYKGASKGLDAFVVQYPQSGLIASAYYWLGSSHYAARDPKTAITHFQTMLQKSPQHPRAADAYLTMARAHDELGDKKRSAELYQYVIKQYPDTAASAVALESLPKPTVKAAAKPTAKKTKP
jgi:tol-pal system protein YbgF